MKVLSIQEPYATLIKEGYKRIETRSWKTTYRGEIFIHSSSGKRFLKEITNKELTTIVDKLNLSYGNIICKATLVDCIEMTEEFIHTIKENNQEYIMGNYEVGRYAWVLQDVTPLENPIKTKGKLGIWEYID